MTKKQKEKYYKPIDNNVGMLRPNVALQLPVANAISEEKKIPKDIFVKNEKPVKKKKSKKTKNGTKLNKVNQKSSSSY